MEWVRSELRDTVGEWARNTDWGLVATVAGFILLVPLSWLTLRVNPSLLTVYERAVRAAAVMRPESGVPLRTIDSTAAQVRVANFATQPPENPLRWDAWVSLPDELKGRCAGASDATLALQQILGLPPDPRPRAVYELSVPREKVLRPCISGSDPATPTCLPVFAAAPLHGEEEATPQKFADLPPDKKDAIYANLNNNYLGSYVFSNLAAYAAGTPILYTRSLGDPQLNFFQARIGTYLQDDIRRTKPTIDLVCRGARPSYRASYY